VGRVSILCGPADAGKTRQLRQRYQAIARSGPPGAALWLGPSHRAIGRLRPWLLDGLPACLAPQLFTFQDFAEEVVRANDPAARPLSHVQRRLLADDLAAELHDRGRLAHFQGVIDTYGFAQTIFDLLAELKQNEIWPEQLQEAIRRRLPPCSDKEIVGGKDWQCAILYREYQDRLIRHHLYDLEGRVWYARDLLSRGARRPFGQVRAVFVDGFTDFTRTQREILQALCGWAEQVWVALPDEPGPERAELFSQPRGMLLALQSLQPTVTHLPPVAEPDRPAGLAHLERELFRPRQRVRRAQDAAGLLCLEAPGMVGEARMVARQIRRLLQGGARPDDVLVVLREVPPYADLLREVFGEYNIAADVEGAEPLARNPAVATLLRFLRLPENNWPFAAVTALLRSTYFRPSWPEVGCASGSGLPLEAEALLRLMGVPRGRDAYLGAVRRWAENPPPGLEDEQAEESRRHRIHELAKKCRPFLERVLSRWDDLPQRATLAEHTAWLSRLADDLGLTRAAAEDARDTAALSRLWDELAQWARIDRTLHARDRLVERGSFQRTLRALAAEAGLARSPRGAGRVRVLSAGLARGLKVPYVFVMGLGERTFPRLTSLEGLLDESERQGLKQGGVEIPCAGDRLPAEMLLFYQIVMSARRLLVLSYAAVDDRGQALLPSSFLADLRGCFAEGAIPVEVRNMLIEGYDRDVPLSAAEHRVQIARSLAGGARGDDRTPLLTAARAVAYERFHATEHSPYDGLLRHPAVVAEVGQMFGPECILSPTALEGYIACPFRFFLDHVLGLEPLEEPSEEIEGTQRGLAFHRALARLHKQLKAEAIHDPTEEVEHYLKQQLEEAVRECATFASPAAAALWRLEGQRLLRAAGRYRTHWAKLLEPWQRHGVRPRPEHFEVAFGLPVAEGETVREALVIAVDGLEVRVSGRIDRVDMAELPDGSVGFWVIDYKTGRAGSYTGSDLKQLRRLQLTLYALAVEEVFLAGQQARPLGLAYWLVTDSGPKVALPGHPRSPAAWLAETDAWERIREALRRWVVTLVKGIRAGQFPLQPRSEDCTQTCAFGQVCRISQSRPAIARKTWHLPLPMV
jgi:ATP-dependent helicase/DNAse subunit B